MSRDGWSVQLELQDALALTRKKYQDAKLFAVPAPAFDLTGALNLTSSMLTAQLPAPARELPLGVSSHCSARFLLLRDCKRPELATTKQDVDDEVWKRVHDPG